MRCLILLIAFVLILSHDAQRGSLSAETEFLRPEAVRPDRLWEFVLTNRCGVVARLSRIHENRESDADRYFILALKVNRPNYVQCIFLDNDARMLCEAVSGFYQSPTPESRMAYLTPDAIAALARLGFSTNDSKGNFQLMIEFDGEPDLDAVAETILTALYEAYGARLGMELEWKSPLATFHPRDSSCVPIS